MTITHRLSGGANNSDPSLSLGGPISVHIVPDEAIGRIGSNDFINGNIRHRCFYVHTTEALTNVRLWIEQDTPSASTQISIAWGSSGINLQEQFISTQQTVPSGVVFTAGTSVVNSLGGGNFPAGSFRAFWVKYVLSSQTSRIDSETFSLGTDGTPAPGGFGSWAAAAGVANALATAYVVTNRLASGSSVGSGLALAATQFLAVRSAAGTSAGVGAATGVGATFSAGSTSGTSAGVGAATGAAMAIRVTSGTSVGVGVATGATVVTLIAAGTSTGVGVATGAAHSMRAAAGTSAGAATVAGVGATVGWNPGMESSLIAWFDMKTLGDFNTTTKVWTARYGSGRTATADNIGPARISNGFATGNKNTLVFQSNADHCLTMSNPGAQQLMTVFVLRVTEINAGAFPVLWSRASLGIGVSGLLSFDFGGLRAAHLTSPADAYSANVAGGGVAVTLHSLNSRVVRWNGTEDAVNNTVVSGTQPSTSDSFRIIPFLTHDATIEIAAVGIFNASGWSTTLAQKCEGFVAHEGIGIGTASLPVGHPYKTNPPT